MLKFKYVAKTLISLTLVLSLLIASAIINVSAEDILEVDTYILSEDDLLAIEKMMNSGLQYEAAYDILRVDRLIKLLECNEQMIDIINGEVAILSAADGSNILNEDDADFLINKIQNEIEKASGANIISQNDAMSQIESLIENNPQEGIYTVDMGGGQTFNVAIEIEEVEILPPVNGGIHGGLEFMEFSPFGYSEVEIYSYQTPVTSDGTRVIEVTVSANSGISYVEAMMRVQVTHSGGLTKAVMSKISSGQSAWGVLSISSAVAEITIPETSYYVNPGIWCRGENQVLVSASATVSLSILGIISFDAQSGRDWTFYAVVKSSIVSIKGYAGYYI